MAKRTYELLLVIEATDDDAAHQACNAAWFAANGVEIGTQQRARVVNEGIRERRKGKPHRYPDWVDWAEDAEVTFSVAYTK